MRLTDRYMHGTVLSPADPVGGAVADQAPADPAASPDTPAAAETPDIAAMVEQEVDRRMAAMQAAAPVAPAQPAADISALPPYDRAKALAEQQGIWDPEKVTAMAIEMATQDAERRIMSAVAPTIQQLQREKTVAELGGGLGERGREYLQTLAPGLDPASLTPQVRDVITRAARDYEREHTPAPVSTVAEPVGGGDAGYTLTAEDRADLASARRFDPTLTEQDVLDAKRLNDKTPIGFGGMI